MRGCAMHYVSMYTAINFTQTAIYTNVNTHIHTCWTTDMRHLPKAKYIHHSEKNDLPLFIQHTTSLYHKSNRNCRIMARATIHQTPRVAALLDQNIVYFGLYSWQGGSRGRTNREEWKARDIKNAWEMRNVNTCFVNKSGSDNVTGGQKSKTDPKGRL